MGRRTLPLFMQRLQLRRAFPNARCDVKRRRVLQWTGQLRPTPLSRGYTVRMSYELGESPNVWVVDPPLERRDGELPPHLYPKQRLCLFLPGKREWDKTMSLAATIVPWASEWLMHYELWLATGVWSGGGEHPGGDDVVDIPQRARSAPSSSGTNAIASRGSSARTAGAALAESGGSD